MVEDIKRYITDGCLDEGDSILALEYRILTAEQFQCTEKGTELYDHEGLKHPYYVVVRYSVLYEDAINVEGWDFVMGSDDGVNVTDLDHLYEELGWGGSGPAYQYQGSTEPSIKWVSELATMELAEFDECLCI